MSMKRSSTTKTSRKCGGKVVENSSEEVLIDWEVRPGGMLVQKRCVVDGSDDSDSMIKIKVSHGSNHHHLTAPAKSTFGELKRVISQETGLEPKDQRLLYRGKEKDDDECLHMAGVKDMSKVILMEDPASKERKIKEMRSQGILKAYEAVAKVREEVDKLAEKVVDLETDVNSGTKVENKEFLILIELLMVQLLKLDAIEAGGEAKVQRRIEVRRVQSFVDAVDNLKARNSNPLSNCTGYSISETTKWETFDSSVGSLRSPKNQYNRPPK